MKIDLSKLANIARPLEDPEKYGGHLRDKLFRVLDDYELNLAKQFAFLEGYYLTVPDGALPAVEDLPLIKLLKNGESDKQEVMGLHQAEAILRRMAGKGNFPHRDQFRQQHAEGLKVDSFKAMWRSVAEDYPQLSRPGPKPKA